MYKRQGKYQVRLDPSGGKGSERFLLPEKRTVKLPKVGDVFLEYSLSLGGRCEVNLNSPSRGAWSAKYELRDAAGIVRLSRTIHHGAVREDGSTAVAYMDSSRVLSFSSSVDWARTSEVIAAGDYTVKVTSKEHETWTSTVTVESGKKVKLRVDLTPKT